MGKLNPNKYFLYKKRFIIGYILLAISFLGLILLVPKLAPVGLSNAEMNSAITSQNLDVHSVFSGNLIDLPYHLLQKIIFKLFGITSYTIRIPSIIMGGLLGFLVVLLLNRWFKNNTAIIASIITVLSSSFLFLVSNGTPLIMIVFWPTLLLWVGSKVQGVKRPAPIWCFIFAIALFLSSFTPYMLYLVILILIYTIWHPHLRFTIKKLPRLPFFLVSAIILTGFGFMGYILLNHPDIIQPLLFSGNFKISGYFNNLKQAFLPFFSWHGVIESIFLAPQISLPATIIAIIGLISTFKGFFASRNSIAIFLILFTIIISGFNTDYAALLLLPFAILIAHGFRYIINKWFDLFPENPYAKLFGVIPITFFLFTMITSDLSHFISGYRYAAPVANQFNSDFTITLSNLKPGDSILIDKENESTKPVAELVLAANNVKPIFRPALKYNIIEPTHAFVAGETFYALDKIGSKENTNFAIQKIITSSKSQNADRLYLYTVE